MSDEQQTKNFVIKVLSLVYAGGVFGILYALIYVTQPMQQAPNDRDLISLLTNLLTFLTGTLSGYLLGSNTGKAIRALNKKKPTTRKAKAVKTNEQI